MDSDTTTASALGLVRHLLTYVGGILVAYGYLTSDQSATLLNDAMQAIGALLGIGMVLWSVRNKIAHAKALKIANAAGAIEGAASAKAAQAKGPPGPLGPKVGAIIALFAAGLWLQGCSTAASAPPDTPRETLVKLESSYTVALATANDLIAQHVLTGSTIAQVQSADHFAGAALDNADAAVALATTTPSQQNQVQAQQALSIAQQAVAGLVAILQQQQAPPAAPGSK